MIEVTFFTTDSKSAMIQIYFKEKDVIVILCSQGVN